MNRFNSIGSLTAVVIGLVIIGFGFMIAFAPVWLMVHKTQLQSTTGTVVNCRETTEMVEEAEYEGGQSYVKTTVTYVVVSYWVGDTNFKETIRYTGKAKHQQGESAVIYYNPQNPGACQLKDPSAEQYENGFVLFIGLGFVAAGSWIIFRTMKKMISSRRAAP